MRIRTLGKQWAKITLAIAHTLKYEKFFEDESNYTPYTNENNANQYRQTIEEDANFFSGAVFTQDKFEHYKSIE